MSEFRFLMNEDRTAFVRISLRRKRLTVATGAPTEEGTATVKTFNGQDGVPALDAAKQGFQDALSKWVTSGFSEVQLPLTELPLPEDITLELNRLGARHLHLPPLRAPSLDLKELGSSYYSPESSSSWVDEDPTGTIAAISATAWAMDRQVSWPHATAYVLDGDVELRFGGTNQNFDTTCNGKRFVSYIIASSPITQAYYALDLADISEDPIVYRLDHDGSSVRRESDSLSGFLRRVTQRD